MKSVFTWWYRFSLPQNLPMATPNDRERVRYARLTSTFTLVLGILGAMTVIYGYFTSINRLAPIIEAAAFACILVSFLFNKFGLNIVAAAFLILSTMVNVVGNMFTNPLDPVYIGIFSALVVPVILAGALMPPVSAFIAAAANCALIILITMIQPHTAEYDKWVRLGFASVMIALPLALQIIVSLVVYVIMQYLILTIRRADRAEEIIALQKEITEHQRLRVQEQQQLEEGIALIADVHAAVAKGNLKARVPLAQESVLWQVAVPLNNLLNRVQYWKGNSDLFEKTQAAVHYVGKELQQGRMQHAPVIFQQPTGTQVDPLLPEINYLSDQAFKTSRSSPFR